MKPSIFVGSSSEALPVARAVQAVLSRDADVTLWSQSTFPLSSITVHQLLRATRRHTQASRHLMLSSPHFFEVLLPNECRHLRMSSVNGIDVSRCSRNAIGFANRSVLPSKPHTPSLQRELSSIGCPARTRSAFAVASRSAR